MNLILNKHKTIRSRPSSSMIILFICISLVLVLIGASYALRNLASQPMAMDEFAINYISTKNWLTENRSPYDPSNAQEVIEMNHVSKDPMVLNADAYFSHPLLSTVFIMPFTFLPILQAKALWMVVNCIIIIIGCMLLAGLLKREVSLVVLFATGLFGVLNYYSMQSILSASMKPIAFLFICMTLSLLQKREDPKAGFICTLALIEFQLSLLMIVFLLIWAGVNRKKVFVRNFWIGLIFQLAISIILLPGWIMGWLRSLILDVNDEGYYSSWIGQISGFVQHRELWINLAIHLGILLVMIMMWINYRTKEEHTVPWIAGLTMSLTSLIVFPASSSSMIISIPALLVVLYAWMLRREKSGISFFLISIAFLLTIPWIFGILVANYWIPILAIALTLIYPFIGLVGLWWIHLWVIKPKPLMQVQT